MNHSKIATGLNRSGELLAYNGCYLYFVLAVTLTLHQSLLILIPSAAYTRYDIPWQSIAC